MQKQTSIYIPKPCHEDWNTMTPTQQGKFCSACSKQVIDFSLMSDNQILNVLSNQSGKLCGRFDAEQLQRPLIETKIKKKKGWWMALTMPLLFLFEKSEAQQISNKTDTITEMQERKDLIVGKLVYNPIKQITIKGKVIDENNEAVPFATISEKTKRNAVAADALGIFSIVVERSSSDIILNASAVGFESGDVKIDLAKDSATIIMKKDTRDLGGVVVVTMGYTIKHKPVSRIDTLKTEVKKALNISAFTIYPNPVVNNGLLNIQIKNAGNYQMQLLDNQSRLIQAEEINIDANNATTQIQLLSNIAAGIYYLRLINEQSKKQYTEKLIIQ